MPERLRPQGKPGRIVPRGVPAYHRASLSALVADESEDRYAKGTMLATLEPITPTEGDKAEAEAGSRFLAHLMQTQETVHLKAKGNDDEEMTEITLSGNLALLVRKVLQAVAQGQPVTILPLQAELTTNQAADLLGVSRPFLIKLLEAGQIAFRQVGTKRRIPVSDLLRYRDENRAKRLETLTALQGEAQALHMGY